MDELCLRDTFRVDDMKSHICCAPSPAPPPWAGCVKTVTLDPIHVFGYALLRLACSYAVTNVCTSPCLRHIVPVAATHAFVSNFAVVALPLVFQKATELHTARAAEHRERADAGPLKARTLYLARLWRLCVDARQKFTFRVVLH